MRGKRQKTCKERIVKDNNRPSPADLIWQDAESFDSIGSWSIDAQHVDIMGSPYLLATGLGDPVDDAVTTVNVPGKGEYTLWVRCRDWLPEHFPGQFQVLVDGKPSSVTFGKLESDTWQWVRGGKFSLEKGPAELRLRDTTGWGATLVSALDLSGGCGVAPTCQRRKADGLRPMCFLKILEKW